MLIPDGMNINCEAQFVTSIDRYISIWDQPVYLRPIIPSITPSIYLSDPQLDLDRRDTWLLSIDYWFWPTTTTTTTTITNGIQMAINQSVYLTSLVPRLIFPTVIQFFCLILYSFFLIFIQFFFLILKCFFLICVQFCCLIFIQYFFPNF